MNWKELTHSIRLKEPAILIQKQLIVQYFDLFKNISSEHSVFIKACTPEIINHLPKKSRAIVSYEILKELVDFKMQIDTELIIYIGQPDLVEEFPYLQTPTAVSIAKLINKAISIGYVIFGLIFDGNTNVKRFDKELSLERFFQYYEDLYRSIKDKSIFENDTFRFRYYRHFVSQKRHGHSSGFSLVETKKIAEKLKKKIGINFYIGNPLEKEEIDEFKERSQYPHIKSISIGGLGGYQYPIPFKEIRLLAGYMESYNKKLFIEHGTSIFERVACIYFPKTYTRKEIKESIPDAKNELTNLVVKKDFNGNFIVNRPISYWYLQQKYYKKSVSPKVFLY